jgi:hypothetical protein
MHSKTPSSSLISLHVSKYISSVIVSSLSSAGEANDISFKVLKPSPEVAQYFHTKR